MRRVLLSFTFVFVVLGGSFSLVAKPVPKPAKVTEPALVGPTWNIAGLTFTVPAKWISETPSNSARVGQWKVPPLKPEEESGEVVALYFGPGQGGTAKENIASWIGTMCDPNGHPAAAKENHRTVGGLKISEVVIFGTYSEPSPLSCIPSVGRMNYGLVGVVVEGPQGSIFWRFTGPEALITANLPLFNKIIDGLKPQVK